MGSQKVSPGFVMIILMIVIFVVFGDKISELLFEKRIALKEQEIEQKVDATLSSITIKDSKFRECLREIFRIKVLATGSLEVDLVEELDSIQCPEKGIKSVKGIDIFTGITTLNLNSNRLKSIGQIKKLKNLEFLSLDDNRISGINELREMENLRFLSLAGNDIYSLDVLLELPSLKSLTLPHTSSMKCSDLTAFKRKAKFSTRSNRKQKCRKDARKPKHSKDYVRRILMKRNTGRVLSEHEQKVLRESGY